MVESKKQPEKEYFTVKMEVLVPATVEYKILAETPEQALDLAKKAGMKFKPTPNIAWNKMKKLVGKVFKFGYIQIEYSRKL